MSRLGDHKGEEEFDLADKKFSKRNNMSGGANVFQRIADEDPNAGNASASPFYFCERTRVSTGGSSVNQTKVVTMNPALTDPPINTHFSSAVTALGGPPTTIIVEMYIDVTSSPTGNRRTQLYASGDPVLDNTNSSIALAKNVGGSRDDAAATGCANLQALIPLDYDVGDDTYSFYWKWTGNTPNEYYIDVIGFSK